MIVGYVIDYAIYQLIQSTEHKQILRWPKEGFLQRDINDISLLIPVATPKEDPSLLSEYVAERVHHTANELAKYLSAKQQKQVAVDVCHKSPLSGIRPAMITWLDALYNYN